MCLNSCLNDARWRLVMRVKGTNRIQAKCSSRERVSETKKKKQKVRVPKKRDREGEIVRLHIQWIKFAWIVKLRMRRDRFCYHHQIIHFLSSSELCSICFWDLRSFLSILAYINFDSLWKKYWLSVWLFCDNNTDKIGERRRDNKIKDEKYKPCTETRIWCDWEVLIINLQSFLFDPNFAKIKRDTKRWIYSFQWRTTDTHQI